MKNEFKHDLTEMRRLISEANNSVGQVLALLDYKDIDRIKIAHELDAISGEFERSTIILRNLCEKNRPNVQEGFRKPPLPAITIAGNAQINEYGWIHITLYTLLPHCRFQSPAYLTDTIVKLLDEYESRGNSIPRLKKAVMIIDEHCDINSRIVYDQDNKGYKAVANAIKGRVIIDDDQFTLGIALISTKASYPSCHVYILPPDDLSDFFYIKYNNNTPTP